MAAGESAKGLIGKRVGLFGGEMYADYRKLPASEAVVLPPAATAARGAAMFVNPLAEALTPDVLLAYERKSTGQKFLIDPRLD